VHHQRVAVRTGARHQLGTQGATRAAAILHDDRLAHRFGHPLGNEAGDDIGGSARGKRHDDADRLRRKGLGVCRYQPGERQCRTGGEQTATGSGHGYSSWIASGRRCGMRRSCCDSGARCLPMRKVNESCAEANPGAVCRRGTSVRSHPEAMKRPYFCVMKKAQKRCQQS
jgi:hypothetical protein